MKYGPVDSTLQPTSHLFTDEAEKLQAATSRAPRIRCMQADAASLSPLSEGVVLAIVSLLTL